MSKPKQRVIRQTPPRYLDAFTQSTILLGGAIQQFGWGFFSFGMIFFWVFVGNSQVFYLFENRNDWKETEGVVSVVAPTNMSENDQIIYEAEFTFIHDYREYVGKSYSGGRIYGETQAVWVIYDEDDPTRSMIKGSRRAPFGYSVAFILIFPLLGAIFIVYQFIRNQRFLKLLKLGVFSLGKQVNKEPTGGSITINNVTYPIYKYTFEFLVKGIARQAICKTHQTNLVEDEEEEIVLYDPLNPSYNMVYDAVPNVPEIDADGYLKPVKWSKILVFVLPILTALINLGGWLLTVAST